jgi:hypothetical protein
VPFSPFVKLDSIAARFWSRVLSLLCNLTGRNNFFFARLFAGIGGGVIILLWLILTALEIQESLFFGVWDLLNVVVFGCLTGLIFRVAGRLEKAFNSGAVELNLVHREAAAVLIVRMSGTVFVIIGFLLGEWLANGFIMLLVGSFYFVLDFRPKRKSMVRKLIEAVARKAGELRLRPPAPMPTPT